MSGLDAPVSPGWSGMGCIAAYRRKRGYLALFSFKYFKHRHHLHKVKIQSCKVMSLPETHVLFVAGTSATNSLYKFIRRVSRNKEL